MHTPSFFRLLLCWLPALLFGPGVLANGMPEIVIQNPPPSFISLQEHLWVMYPKPGEQILAQELAEGGYADRFALHRPNKQLSSPTEGLWIAFRLRNDAGMPADYTITLGDASISEAEIYIFEQGRNTLYATSGLLIPNELKTEMANWAAFPIHIEAGSELEVYIQVRSVLPVGPFLSIVNDEYYHPYLIGAYKFLGLFYGILFLLIAYNLLLFFSTRQYAHLVFVGYVLATGILTAALDGMAGSYLFWLLSLTGGKLAAFAGVLAQTGSLLFVRTFIRRSTVSALERNMVWAALALQAFTFWLLIVNFEIGFQLLPLVILSVALLNFWLIYRVPKSQLHDKLFLLAAYLPFYMIISQEILYSFELGETHTLSEVYPFHFGFLYHTVVLAAALNHRINRLRQELHMAEAEKEREKQALIAQKNRELEEMVQRRTESLQARNNELIQLNNDLDRFFYSISHDLKAPLNSLMGLVQIIKMEASSDQIQEYARLQENSIRKLQDFLGEMLDFAKNARTGLQKDQVDFKQVIADTFEQFAFSEGANRIEKIVVVEQSGPFATDAKRLQIVLNNLISNAIHYYNPNKDKPFIEVVVRCTEQQATISVQDNGIGIQAAHLQRIFEMFYRANNLRSGSGLGLYIVKETVEKMGGEITVQSEYTVGTLFTLQLPNLETFWPLPAHQAEAPVAE